MGTNPYDVVRQPNLKSGNIVYSVSKVVPVPASIRTIAGDAIQNLRTALDYLACGLVLANNHPLTKETGFPILKGDFRSDIRKSTFDGKVEGMRDEAINVIKSLNPYKGGDDVLWTINALNNIDKHRLLVAAGTFVFRYNRAPLKRAINILNPEQLTQTLSDTLVPITGTFPLYEGQEILVDPRDMEPDENVEFFFEVAINEPQEFPPAPLALVLRQSYRRVVEVVGMLIPFLR